MGAAVAGVLAVDEGGDVLSIALAVGQDDLDVVALEVDQRVERGLRHVLGDEVEKAVFRFICYSVEDEGQPLLQVGVVFHHRLHEVHVVGVVAENEVIGDETDECAVLFGRLAVALVLEVAADEGCVVGFAVAVGLHEETFGERVDGLGADAVETDGLLEVGVVELAAGVELGGRVDDFVEGNAASEVTDGDDAVFYGDDDLRAVAHRELVDGIVDDLLEEDVDAVALVVAVARPADVHAGAAPDVLVPLEGDDAVAAVG